MNDIIKHIRNKGKLALTAAVLAGCSASALAAATGNTLKGRVVDPDGNPVPGAAVNLAEQSKVVFTNENG